MKRPDSRRLTLVALTIRVCPLLFAPARPSRRPPSEQEPSIRYPPKPPVYQGDRNPWVAPNGTTPTSAKVLASARPKRWPRTPNVWGDTGTAAKQPLGVVSPRPRREPPARLIDALRSAGCLLRCPSTE